ncbi:metallophosphoesterase [Virgisporangium aurantiacum]|uniref:Metallophosphoesterase n=1 Tax=Virgisporangium aurantiacum TaxID=175570 RepID=A0A8J3Z5G9_9ACTN|nr:metallophosphoesterase [Virgisporangium aurantiacum]
MVTGDITMRARADEFCLAVALLARLPEPQLVVPGNHDVPLGPVPRLTEPYRRYSAALGVDPNPSVLWPSARSAGTEALGLNSMPRWRWKSGRVTRRQAAAITASFGAAPGAAAGSDAVPPDAVPPDAVPPDAVPPDAVPPDAVRLVALHHPPFVGGLARLGGRGRLTAALAGARVDLVLAGHTHVPVAREVELVHGGRTHRVIEVVAGTATSLRTRDGAGRSWSLIVIDGCAVEVRERRQTGSGWRTTRTVRFDRRS